MTTAESTDERQTPSTSTAGSSLAGQQNAPAQPLSSSWLDLASLWNQSAPRVPTTSTSSSISQLDTPQAATTIPRTPSPSTNDLIRNNPWYPLKGPPQTDQERELLNKHMSEERARVQSDAHAAHSSQVDTLARANCADLAFDLNQCRKNRGFDAVAGGCFKIQDKYKKCISIQKRNLQLLGIMSSEIVSNSQLKAIADKADDMYLEEMRAEDAKDSMKTQG